MTQQAGRRLRVTYTDVAGTAIGLVDSTLGFAVTPAGIAAVQGAARSLDCEVDITRHLKPSPQPSLVTVYGLGAERRAKIVADVATARELSYTDKTRVRAGRIKVEIGLADTDLEVLAEDEIINVRVGDNRLDSALIFEGVDGRQEWDALFIAESEVPTPDNLAGQAGLSKPPPAAPGKLRSVTYKLTGPGEADALAVFASLGVAPVYTAGGPRWISAGASLTLPALDLSTALVGPVGPPGEGGTRRVRVNARPGLLAGRQVLLGDGAARRIDEMRAVLSNYRADWYADLTLRLSG